MEQNKKSGLDGDERTFREMKRCSFLKSDGKFSCTLNAVCKQLEDENINKLYVLDKIIGFSIASEAAGYPNENYSIYSLIQDGQRLIADKIAKIEYPYIRKSIYDTFFNMLTSALVGKTAGIKEIVEFYDCLKSIDMVEINAEISRFMCQFYDYVIQGAYMSGVVQSPEGDALILAMCKMLKNKCINSKERELNGYINKDKLKEIKNWGGDKHENHFKSITKDIYEQMR